MALHWQQHLFETLYKNRYLYWFASTIPFDGQWRMWQRLVLPRLQGHDVLELGCGTGELLADMIDEGYNCYAIDQSQEMVNTACSTLQTRHLSEPTKVRKGDAQELPFDSALFDNVVSVFPSEYILNSKTLSQIERVLRPGGRLIVVLTFKPAPIGFISPLSFVIHLFTYGFGVFCRSDEEVSQRVDELMRPLLEQHGLCYRSELVDSQHWKVCIVSGEKPKFR